MVTSARSKQLLKKLKCHFFGHVPAEFFHAELGARIITCKRCGAWISNA